MTAEFTVLLLASKQRNEHQTSWSFWLTKMTGSLGCFAHGFAQQK
jgi:hypothetical protein